VAATRLADLVKQRVGVTARCTVADPGGIERSLGKAKRVIDKRPKD
jgi:phenylacetate-CoA ligase